MKPYKLIIPISLFFLVTASYVGLYRGAGSTPQHAAQRVISRCQNEAHRPACYEREIPKLMNTLSMEDAFAVTRLVQDADPAFAYCHVVAHKLTAIETKKNPLRWKDVMLRCPQSACNYGCLHGSLIERFRGETLSDTQIAQTELSIKDLCEPRPGFAPTEIERTMCYHGIGHLAMYMTGGDPARSIPVCERLAKRDDGREYIKTCVEGVFMTVFQSIDPEDLALVIDIRPNKQDVGAFCEQYGVYVANCRRESYAMFADETQTAEGLRSFCSYARGEEEKRDCYWAVINAKTTIFFEQSDSVSRIGAYCRSFPADTRSWCWRGAAMRLVQIDPLRNVRAADSVCAMGSTQTEIQSCYQDLLYYAEFSFEKNSQPYKEYCGGLAESWRQQCVSQ